MHKLQVIGKDMWIDSIQHFLEGLCKVCIITVVFEPNSVQFCM